MGRPVKVSRELWDVLTAAQQLAERSDGAFDITVGPYVELWRRARREKEMPPPRIAWPRPAGRRLSPCKARLGRAARGTAPPGHAIGSRRDRRRPCDRRSIAVLRPPGNHSGPGRWQRGCCRGRSTARRAWLAGRHRTAGSEEWPAEPVPHARQLRVTTSGDAWQYVELDGKRYAHILDPKTGLGLTDRSLVIVVERDGISADSLTKAVAVLGPKRGLAP